MCGIVGIVNNGSRAVDRAVLERMNMAIVHRGPDDDGFYVRENVGLAMRRLSIIDLAGGKQPIHNADKTKWIVFNGEIYNYREIREDLDKRGHKFYTNSDTEAIVHLYDEFGADCLQYLRGMFAFAIWDETAKELFIARDRVGKKPLLYSHRPNGDLIFGSEFKALLEDPTIEREVDHEAIDAYLSYLCVPAPMTAFKQIRKLEPGHWLKWKAGEVKMQRYWLPDFSKKIKISETEAIEETTRILRESTKMRMISEVPLGAFLSGGVDSSIVVALMAQESPQPIKTFSIGFEEQDFSELKYARRVAEHVGAEYHEFIVKPDALEVLPTLVEHYGEPYADSSAIPTYYVAKETRQHVTVALNGDGGDESFAGYERYAAMVLAEKYRRIPDSIRETLLKPLINVLPSKRGLIRNIKGLANGSSLDTDQRYLRWVTTFTEEMKADVLKRSLTDGESKYGVGTIIEGLFENKQLELIDAMLCADLQTYLTDDLLVKVDIASMANSLEARSPFLDHELIAFVASLPVKYKFSGFQTKYLLKKIASTMVPKEVIYRKKMGFGMPIAKWLRSDMKDMLTETLTSEKFVKREIFKPEAISRLIKEHLDGSKDHSWQLWTLLMLELWYIRYIDQ